jgi:diphosphomevalonate decarboxylase
LEKGDTSEKSYAHALYPSTYWDLRDIVVRVTTGEKSVSSSVGHEQAETSPLFLNRLQEIPERINTVFEGLQNKDLSMLGPAIEADAMSMHQVMQTQTPPLMYFTEDTKMLLKAVVDWRTQGLSVYYTIDAGPNVHIICEGKDEQRVVENVKQLNSAWCLLINKPSPGTHIIDTHLF